MNDRFKTPAAKRILAVALAGLGLLSANLASAQEPASWRVLIEPTFMSPPVTQPIPEAKKTVLVAAYEGADGELTDFAKADFAKLGVKWSDFAARAAQNTKSRALKTELVRDSKNVIQVAKLTSESPLTATAVLAPGFGKKFADIFGERPLVVIPNRYTILVFPRLASTYQDYAPLVLDAFRATPFPVSLEVFEVGETGLRAVGSYAEP